MLKLRLLVLVGLIITCCVQALFAQDVRTQAQQALAEADTRAVSVVARQQALAKAEEASRLFLSLNENIEAARALSKVGILQLKLNSPQEAIATHQKALALLGLSPDIRAEVDNLNGLASAYDDQGKFEEARKYLERAIQLCDQTGYKTGKSEALLTLSNGQNQVNHTLALTTAQQSLALAREADSKIDIGYAYGRIGQYNLALNNMAEAKLAFAEAIKVWREINVRSSEAAALIMLAYIEQRHGNWDGSFALLTQAQGLIDEEAEPFKKGQVLAFMADTFIESGLPELGLVKAEQALEQFRKLQSPIATISMMLLVGKAHLARGDYKEAANHFRLAIKAAEESEDRNDLNLGHEFLGIAYNTEGNQAAALPHFQYALDEYEKISNPMEAARVRARIGLIYKSQGQFGEAQQYYYKALKTFRALSDQVNQAAVNHAMGQLEMETGNIEAAENYFRQAIEDTEKTRRVSTSRDLTAAFSATVQERYEAYIDCLMRQKRYDEALAQSELARARSLGESLRQGQTIPGLEPELAARESGLRQSLRIKRDAKVALLSHDYKKEDLAALDNEIASLEGEYAQVEADIKAHYPAYAQVAQSSAWDLRKIQQEVITDNETVLLEYSLSEQRSYLWAVTRDDFKSYELPARAKIETVAQRIYQILQNTPKPETQAELAAASRELSRMILQPAAEHLGKQRLIIVADGALHYLPFQVLPASSGEPLIAQHEIINAPSATVLGQLQEETARKKPAAKLLAAFGNPVFPANFARYSQAAPAPEVAAVQTLETERFKHAFRELILTKDKFDPSQVAPLDYAPQEMDNLRALAEGSDALIASEFDATRERLQSEDLSQYRILHFATHGYLDSQRPENSLLALSLIKRDGQPQEGALSLSDVYNLRAPVDLVVMSACRTGLGKEVRGEGLIGLTRGFMYAGASSVVSSLWKVSDEATAELMKQFYANLLQKGMTSSLALREAQNHIRQQPHWNAPFYWAAFTLQGEYRQTIMPPPARWFKPQRVAGAALLAALLAAGLWWYRRRCHLASKR